MATSMARSISTGNPMLCNTLHQAGVISERVVDSAARSNVDPIMNALTETLQKFAKSDLRAAAKFGEIAICETKRGTLFLRKVDKTYTLSTAGLASEVLIEGKPAVVVPVLAALYTVVEEA